MLSRFHQGRATVVAWLSLHLLFLPYFMQATIRTFAILFTTA